VLVLLLALLAPGWARAGRDSMIPPGQEQRIRAFVDEGIEAARAADELPVALDETVDLHIDRDRITVLVHARDGSLTTDLPRVIVFHPEAVPEDVGGAVAPGIVLRCGPPGAPRSCESDEAAPWLPLARRIAAARTPVADLVWQVEEESAPPRVEHPAAEQRSLVWADRGAAIGAVLLGLGLAAFGVRRGRGRPEAITWPELALLLALLVAFVGATLSFTSMLPLHEHNSFIARSDCAVDPRCTEDPAGAWNMTSMHVYGLLLSLVPYHPRAVAAVSLGCSVLVLVLVWALARVLTRALGRPELGAVAGLTAVGVLATHPVAWRLAGAATFWPYAIAWALGAALAGLWAGLATHEGEAERDRVTRIAAALAWIVAAACLAIACGGNFVLLTLGTCLGLAPLCWTPAWRPPPEGARRWRAAALRVVLVGLPAVAVFALVASADFTTGYARAFAEEGGLDGSITFAQIRNTFSPLLLDRRISAPVWIVPLIACLGWLWPPPPEREGAARAWLRPARIFAPLVYAWLIPGAFLGLAAGEVLGSGYPVGFINHHWELCWTALAAGLGVAWIVARLARWRPLGPMLARVGGERVPALERLRWAHVLPALLIVLAALWGPRVEEGWRLATGERVLERELLALEAAWPELPEHDLLVIPPRLLEPTTDARTEWDPLEVVFPRGFYGYAMRERGLEPAPVVELDRMQEPRPGARVLFYLGSSLRSFQPHEIAHGGVPEDLERPVLRELHHAWSFEAVYEFRIATEQHWAHSQRLGADRMPEIELGFYWLHPREH
jgi:hypothetical protein